MTIELGGAPVPEDVEAEARRDVRLETRSARYRTDQSGSPTDPRVAGALEAAALAQAQALLFRDEQDAANKAAASLSPLGKPLASASIGGASYTVEQGTSTAPGPFQLPGGGRLCSAAHDILFDAGLLYGNVAHYG